MKLARPAWLLAGLLLAAGSSRAQTWQAGPQFPEAPSPRLQAAGLYWEGLLWALGGSPFDQTSDQDGASDYLGYGDPAFTKGGFLSGQMVSQGAGMDALGRAVVFGGWVGPDGDRGATFLLAYGGGFGGSLPNRSATAPPANFAWTTDSRFRIYSIGGGPGSAATAGSPNSTRVERFDALLNAWEVLAPLPFARANAAAAEDGYGRVLVFGGLDAAATTRLSSVLVYDIAAGTWATGAVPPLPNSVSNARAVLGPDQRIYVIGGYTGPVHAGVPSAAVWILDLRSNTWAQGPSLGTPRADPAVAYDPDYASIFAMCGDDGAGGNFTTEMLAVETCPTFALAAQPETLCIGRTAGFQVQAAGDDPISLQWRRNGVPLSDGPTASGSIISGATAALLEIRNITASDAGVYDALATNGCGSRTSPAAALVVTSGPILPPASDWTVTEASFSPHSTILTSISGGLVGGGYDAIGYNGFYWYHGFRWDGKASDPISGMPVNSSLGSYVFDMAGPLCVGYRQWLFSTSRGAHYIYSQGEVWATVGGTTSYTTLPTGFALGTDGVQIVGGSAGATGSAGAAAILWTAPHPRGRGHPSRSARATPRRA